MLNPANVVFPLILFALVLYQTTLASLLQLWTSGNSKYSHGILLLGISVLLFCRRWKGSLHRFRLQPNAFGIFLLAATSILWFLANLGHVQIAQQLALPMLVGFLLWSVLGYQTTKS
ncbi:MAG: archaeosortase/exosortase family protein, partial [Acidiferrobacterales bacterium]